MERRREAVYVVVDEPATERELREFLQEKGRAIYFFDSIEEFLEFTRADSCGCIIVGRKMFETEGNVRNAILRCPVPVIFTTRRGDTFSAVSAMKAGAIDVVTTPLVETQLLASVERAMKVDRANRQEANKLSALLDRYQSLTPREREILPLLTNGLLNKQAAYELGITEYTVQIHRGHIMRKMAADSFAALVKIATKLNLEPAVVE